MTVSSTTTEVSYAGNDSTTEFAVTFPFYELLVVTITGVTYTTLTETTHYTVAGGDGSTGTVTILTPPASGTRVWIRRNTTKTQETDYAENDPFPAETHEKALDRLTMMVQDLSNGFFAIPRTDATIASGAITAASSWMRLDTEGAASTDDLDTIYGGASGRFLLIRPTITTRTIVMKDRTGNLYLTGDFTMDNSTDTILLVYDTSHGAWLEVSRSNNGA